MAITIIQEKKKQRYLILVLSLIIFAILFVVWLGFSRSKATPPVSVSPSAIYTFPQVKINWQLLENIRLEPLQPFEEISSFEGEFGRNNPFIPY